MIVCKKICLPEESIWFLMKEVVRLVDMQLWNNFPVFSTLLCLCASCIHCTVLQQGLPCCLQKCDHELIDYTKYVSAVDGTV